MNEPVKVDGLRDLRRNIKRLNEDELPRALRDANRGAAALVARRALPNVPVRTGRLRKSVKALASQSNARVKAGSRRVPYAAVVHWGRKRGNVGSPPGNRPGRNVVTGKPFLYDALERSRREIIDTYQEQIDEMLRTVGRRV